MECKIVRPYHGCWDRQNSPYAYITVRKMDYQKYFEYCVDLINSDRIVCSESNTIVLFSPVGPFWDLYDIMETWYLIPDYASYEEVSRYIWELWYCETNSRPES